MLCLSVDFEHADDLSPIPIMRCRAPESRLRTSSFGRLYRRRADWFAQELLGQFADQVGDADS